MRSSSVAKIGKLKQNNKENSFNIETLVISENLIFLRGAMVERLITVLAARGFFCQCKFCKEAKIWKILRDVLPLLSLFMIINFVLIKVLTITTLFFAHDRIRG